MVDGNHFRRTVKLDFKNRQDKIQLVFKSQIIKDRQEQITFKNRQDKNNLTLRAKVALTKNVVKVKFDCIQSWRGNYWHILKGRQIQSLGEKPTILLFLKIVL